MIGVTQRLFIYVNGEKQHDYYPTWGGPPSEIAVGLAERLPSGSVIKLKQGTSSWTYQVGRLHGLPSVTRMKATSHKRSR